MSPHQPYPYPLAQDAPLCEEELKLVRASLRDLCHITQNVFSTSDRRELYDIAAGSTTDRLRDEHGINAYILGLRTASIFAEMVDVDRNLLVMILLTPAVANGTLTLTYVEDKWGADVAALISGHLKVREFATRSTAVNEDNFRGLLLSLAKDIRIIIVMIVESLALMRFINHHPHTQWVRNIAFEADCLYAQLAHRLGLYKIKGELEDLSLKYTNRDIYTGIARRLNETKKRRDAYIEAFIAPVKDKLTRVGLKFTIKGRTKSISSIWAKIKKQKVDIEHIYDLFAIRVIIDTAPEKEKSDCWLAYSILADMYTANPARMKDWISIPKSNGYESLHATVMGPENKWVEVQFRTVRMDLIAEKGLAAHWRYKGGKSDATDKWMNNIRDILESADAGPMQLMRSMKADQFQQEVYVFTPKGDLFRLPDRSTVLDFAFHIHSSVGSHCTGARINGRHQKITYRLHSGDTVEILTSQSQTPKQDWLNIVVSGRAKNKIRQALNEAKAARASMGRELLERRIKNRKLSIDESSLLKIMKRFGYKYGTDFYADINDQVLDLNKVLSEISNEMPGGEQSEHISAEEFKMQTDTQVTDEQTLVIGRESIKDLNYRLSKCCNPVYGDPVFGFISSEGVVKVHRCDCPNASHIRTKYPYRLISVKWGGDQSAMQQVRLRVVGVDDLGIVTSMSSIINKQTGIYLRGVNIDSHDNLFEGVITVGMHAHNSAILRTLIRKLEALKGVKSIVAI